MRTIRPGILSLLLLAGCGAPSSGAGDGDGACPSRCTSAGWEECLAPGDYADPVPCEEDQICLGELGCKACVPDALYCDGDEEIWQCSADGRGGEHVETCSAGTLCSGGRCKSPCERAEDQASNVGCHFWATDLDNEAVSGLVSNDAAAQQYAIAIANDGDEPVEVRVYRNAGRVGEPPVEELVVGVTVGSRDLERIDLPQREIDGTMGQNASYQPGSGSGTFVSPHAYRIETTGPVVAYQFNPIVQQFSNDASILIPRQALGRHYFVLGWPTSNPCGPPPGDPLHQESVPDRAAITIVGTEDDTRVTVWPTHPVVGSAGDSGAPIPRTEAGQPIELVVDRYDVVNLESDQPVVPIQQCLQYLDRDGDFTGTVVESDRPVAVFSSLERGSGTGGADLPDPPGWDGDGCCTDHLEQQMFPTAALGWTFAVTRSPVRSTDPSYREPDLYRLLGTEDGTVVTTNLPAPHDRFELDAGGFVTFHADQGFTAHAEGGAVMLGQYLVSQGRIPQGGIGDPTFVVFPAAEQHRKEYVFLVPATFSQNHVVLALPETATVAIDGEELGALHDCASGPVGVVDGVPYRQLTCPMTEGVHTVTASEPVGLTVYGYYNVGSYGYPGGADVEIINPIE